MSSWVGQTFAQAGLRIKWSGSSLSMALRLPGQAPPPAAPVPGLTPALAVPGCGHVHHATPAPEEDPLAWDGMLNAVPKQKTPYRVKRVRHSANSKLYPTVGAFCRVLRPFVADAIDSPFRLDDLPFYSAMCVLAALVHCPGCGRPKRAHHLCEFCFSQINRWQKLEFGRSNKARDVLLEEIKQLPVNLATGNPHLAPDVADKIETPKEPDNDPKH